MRRLTRESHYKIISMKLLLHIAGILCLTIASLFLLYGSVKLYRSDQGSKVEIAPGIEVIEKKSEIPPLAIKGFTAAAIFTVIGVVLFLFSRSGARNGVASPSEPVAEHTTTENEPESTQTRPEENETAT